MDYCISCGGYVPEGRMICVACMRRAGLPVKIHLPTKDRRK